MFPNMKDLSKRVLEWILVCFQSPTNFIIISIGCVPYMGVINIDLDIFYIFPLQLSHENFLWEYHGLFYIFEVLLDG